jgi:hypothetical protein
MKMSISLLFISALCACSNQTNNNRSSKTNSGSDSAGLHSKVKSVNDSAYIVPAGHDTSIYSIQLNGTMISLQQWDSTLNLEQLLGKPIKQRIKKLDLNSDTHAGSFIKDLEFEGLKLKLFSPPQNGKHFWILEIILTNNKYKTTKGVTIGDPFEKVKQVYPALKKFPGENENMFYVSDQSYEKSMEMDFEKNKLRSLRLYYMIP